MAKQRFEFREGSSAKFWQIEIKGKKTIVEWGRIGTKGQSKEKALDSPAAARKERDRLVAQKSKKGYKEVGRKVSFEEALVSFVNDVSNGNEEMMSSVHRLVVNPPEATTEATGFYLCGNESDHERVFRKTISNLEDYGFVLGYEDKYIDEMLENWFDTEFIPTANLAPETVHYAQRLAATASREADDHESRQAIDQFEAVATDVEAALEKAGQAILSIELSGGDTLFAFKLPTALAMKWRDVEFTQSPKGEPLGVRGFMWTLYADFLWYAVRIRLSPQTGDRASQPLRPLSDEHLAISQPKIEVQKIRRVRHPKFGLGQIVREIGAGDDRKLEIEFEDVGNKIVLARFIELLD